MMRSWWVRFSGRQTCTAEVRIYSRTIATTWRDEPRVTLGCTLVLGHDGRHTDGHTEWEATAL